MTEQKKKKTDPPAIFLVGVLTSLICTFLLVGGACDATEITCERAERVDCSVATKLFGWKRSRRTIFDVVAASYDYDQPSRTDLAFAHSASGGRLYLESTDRAVSEALAAFLADPGQDTFHLMKEPPAAGLLVLIGVGLIMVIGGLFKWRSKRRSLD